MPVPGSIDDLSATPSENSPQGSEPVGTQANEYIQALSGFVRQLADGKINNGTLDAPKGTRLVLQQATAPVGWVVDTDAALTDCAMRFNQSVARGGETSWSGWNFGNTFSVDGHAITADEMPSHAHGVSDPGHSHGVNDPGHNHGVNDPGHSHGIDAQVFNVSLDDIWMGTFTGAPNTTYNTKAVGTGISLNASGTGVWLSGATAGISIQATGGNQAHSHTFKTPQVKYADCVVAVKQ